MYRLPCTLSFAFLLGVNSFGVAEEAKLEFTFLEEMPATPRTAVEDPKSGFSLLESKPLPAQVAAENPKPVFSLLEAAPSAEKAVAPTSKLTFTFLEDMQPAGTVMAPKTRAEFENGANPIDFDMIFATLPDDKSSAIKSAPSPKTAVVSIPAPPVAVEAVPGIPDPVTRVPVPVAAVVSTPAPKPVVELVSKPQVEPVTQIAAVPAPVETSAATAVGNGVQPTTAIEQVNSIMVADESLPPPVAVEGDYVTPMGACGTCNSTATCQCQSKGQRCNRFTTWWHSTDLYRLHVQNVGQPDLFCERPLGVCIDGFAGAMIAAGKADRAMLHHYDFVHHADGGIELTQRGRGELGRIAGIMADFAVPLSIESTFNPSQDAARRNAVVNAIAQQGLQISPDSIRITADRTIGLTGIDAQAIHVIRTAEAASGASRTRPYQDASGATQIPLNSGNRGAAPR